MAFKAMLANFGDHGVVQHFLAPGLRLGVRCGAHGLLEFLFFWRKRSTYFRRAGSSAEGKPPAGFGKASSPLRISLFVSRNFSEGFTVSEAAES